MEPEKEELQDVKQELNVMIKEEEHKPESSGDNSQEGAVKTETHTWSFLSDVTGIKTELNNENEYCNELQDEDPNLKFEEETSDILGTVKVEGEQSSAAPINNQPFTDIENKDTKNIFEEWLPETAKLEEELNVTVKEEQHNSDSSGSDSEEPGIKTETETSFLRDFMGVKHEFLESASCQLQLEANGLLAFMAN